MNTRTGADVHNQPKIYIENPAENSHISPYICQLIHFTNYGSRMPKFVGWLPCIILRNSLLLLSYSITSREKIKSAKR